MLRKKIIATILLLTSLASVFSVYAEPAATGAGMAETARSYVLMEASSGKILLEKNMDDEIPPASITKVMTLLLIHEAVAAGKINWDDPVTVSSHAAGMGGSQIFMEEGEQQPVRDLVKAICIASANDAAVAMAEYIGGSESQFVDMMNARAKELGMEHTTFKNACGLHVDGHVSSAHDVALMSRELISKFPEISKTLTTWMDTITHHTRKGDTEFGLTNTNKMIKWYNGLTGLKTGYTPQAKHCVSATANRDDMNLIAVVMGSQDGKIRFREAAQLLDFGFANYKVKKGPEVGEVLGSMKVKKGDMKAVELTIENSMAFVVPKDRTEKEFSYEIKYDDENVIAPVYKNQKLGTIVYSLDGEVVGEAPLVAAFDVGKAKFNDMLPYMAMRYFRLS
ncbi:D-alanyl-D-alanine carboxypeptidase family protein [Niameybacter massiliensis]|uniref:D-alanyl-D-alanine carboxypeptidase family protein n=1 Tax=Niameybacter massiliensis TaxID=1658108 RepID=UPI0006B4AA6F|nr:D-alanyl-D-alanine carboxypeptidase family protein [Niameybacter massiliensis]